VRNIVWRIDAEFRLSAVLVEEYATMNDIAREQSEEGTNLSKLDVRELAGDITLGVQQKKQINVICFPFLTNAISAIILIETGKQCLVRQSRQDVTSVNHQDLLDEIWGTAIAFEQRPWSDTQSERTLVDEKDHEKDPIDWVKLGFQGKSPETDFRATGLLGLKQLHSFCTTYPVLAQRLVKESGSSQSLQIAEPWYPFALVGIHITRTILDNLCSNQIQQEIILKVHGNVIESVARICQDLYDCLFEEFHAYWIGLVKRGIVKDVFDFERVYKQFKRAKEML